MALDKETITPAQWSKFFNAIAKCNTVSHACRIAKISRATAYYQRKNNDYIAERWAEAEQAGIEYLEEAGLSRAIKGVKKERGIYFEGRLVAVEVEHKYSDTIWLAAMAARDPRYKRDNSDDRVLKELETIFQKLQRGLPSEVYQMVLNVLATEANMIDVTPTTSATETRAITEHTNSTADV